MGHYDCKSCDATPYEEHSPDCERFGTKPALTEGTDMNQIEKVARALCEHAIIKAYTRQDRVEELAPFRAVEVDHLWRNHIPEAKAAIAAMQPAPQKPVAWMYEGPAMLEDETIIQDRKCFPLRQIYKPSGWTETPLYARPTPPAGGSDAE